MHFLQEYALVGDRDFLDLQEEFLLELDEGDFLAVHEMYRTWLENPLYPSLKTKKIANGKNSFSLWESRMTKKIRLRFVTHDEDGARMPAIFDLHDDSRKTLSSVFGRAQTTYVSYRSHLSE